MPERKVTRVEFPQKPLNLEKHIVQKRVAAYARVSTGKEEQENSLQSQQEYFEQYIKSNLQWAFAGLYVDNGISGLSFRKREGFNRMVQDALDGEIDIIVTKSLSRFARNTVDSLTIIRKLKTKGVSVYFEKENIDTLDAKGEFLITLMSSFAEEESRSISENVTWAIRHRFAEGLYSVPFGLFLGYRRGQTGDLVIDSNEAKIVQFIYMLALGGKSSTDICRILMQYEIPTPNRKKIWQAKVISSILQNEKYKGVAMLQKSYTVDFLTKTRKKNEGEVPQYYVEDGHPAIIREKTWDEAQATWVKANRRNCTYNPMANKIICGDCHGLYGLKIWHSTSTQDPVWECNNRKAGRTRCTSCHLYDTELKDAVKLALKHLLGQYPDVIFDCKEIWGAAIGSVPEDVLSYLDIFTKLSPDDIFVDGLVVSILIAAVNVTPNYNLIFHFLDAKTFRYQICVKTPKGMPGMYTKEKNHQKILSLSQLGYSGTEISRELAISRNSVRSFLRRYKKSK